MTTCSGTWWHTLVIAVPTIPPSFAIMAVAALAYAGAATFRAARLRDRQRLIKLTAKTSLPAGRQARAAGR